MIHVTNSMSQSNLRGGESEKSLVVDIALHIINKENTLYADKSFLTFLWNLIDLKNVL